MIDPRKLIRNLLKMVKENTEGSYNARNSISINPIGMKYQERTVADRMDIYPDDAQAAYDQIITDPNKDYKDLNKGVSQTTLESPDGKYKSTKIRIAKGAMDNDTPISNISFTNAESSGEGYDRPNRRMQLESRLPDNTRGRGYQDYYERLDRNELKAMLGRQLDDIRPGSKLNIYAHKDDGGGPARMRMYGRETNRMITDNGEGSANAQRLGRNTWTNSQGESVTFDPKDLKKPLKEMTKQIVTRYLLRMSPFVRAMPLANSLLTGADLGQLMVDTVPKNTSSSGRGGGRSALND